MRNFVILAFFLHDGSTGVYSIKNLFFACHCEENLNDRREFDSTKQSLAHQAEIAS